MLVIYICKPNKQDGVNMGMLIVTVQDTTPPHIVHCHFKMPADTSTHGTEMYTDLAVLVELFKAWWTRFLGTPNDVDERCAGN